MLQRDQAQAMCALSFLRLEEMMDNQNNNQEIRLEPQGVLHAKVTSSYVQGLRTKLDQTNPDVFHLPQLCFINTVAERQPRLRRQRCIFTKERGQHQNQFSLPSRESVFISAHIIFLPHDPIDAPQGRTSCERLR